MIRGTVKFTVLLTVLAPKVSSDTNLPQLHKRDIRKFLDVNEVIWTYNSTRGSTLFCRKDTKLYSNEKLIRFERSHFLKSSRLWTEKYLEGNYSALFPWKSTTENYHSIFVGSIGRKWNKEELLVYQSDDNSCGVFKIFTRGKPINFYHVDLRMKNSSVGQGPSAKCVESFIKRLKKRKSYVLYYPECQANVINYTDIFTPPVQ
ncbi:uncharacterized protein LOC119168074 [Rhipicephalus microplus]|uniref:uncharacterized protein LOC119168074 n=1 Tax=Rhipicephalus microplus TaxID=6941 RepID=UPI003F6BFCD1